MHQNLHNIVCITINNPLTKGCRTALFSPNVLGLLNPQSLCPEAVSAKLIDAQRWSSEWGRRWGLEICLSASLLARGITLFLHGVSILQVAGQSRMSLENLRGKDMQQFKRDRRGEVHVDEEAEGRAGT